MSINDEIKQLLESSKTTETTVDDTDEVVEQIESITEETLDESNEYSKVFKSHHFKQKGTSSSGTVYSHPSKGSVTINKHGHWHHIPHGSSSEDGFEGTTGESLHNHLSRVKESKEQEETMTVDVSEDVNALLNGEELSEEFKTKAATIFEAAVVTRVKDEVTKLEESYATKLSEEVAQIKEGIADKVDGYLNLVVEQWMSDNEIALTQGIKSEIMENFLSGIKSVFEQNYIEIPEEKFDVLESMESRIAELESKLDEATEKNVKLHTEVSGMRKDIAISEACEGLTDTQVDKFISLVEELSFEDEETFTEKLKTIRENYFVKPSTKKQLRETFITDEAIEEPEVKKIVDPAMNAYLNAIDRQSKF